MGKIRTYVPDPFYDYDFREHSIASKIIIKSEWLRDTLADLSVTSETLTLLVSPDRPNLRLSTMGSAGSAEVDYPKETDVIESFSCERIQVNSFVLWQT